MPLLPTSVVGSHALPGWLVLGREAQAAGRLGPVDRRELIEDATRIALLDQLEAGVDVPANGEMGREDFTLGFFGRLAGLRALPAPRRLGVPSYDTHPPYDVVERVTAPDGLGLVEEWRMTRRLTDRPLRATCPGPFTLAIPLRHAGGPYRDRDGLLADLAAIVNAELRALAEAGAELIQVDEPNFAMLRGGDARERVALFNRTVEGVPGTVALHVCFGNLHSKPFATPREYRPLFPALLDARCRQLVLEFANREMAELELLKEIGDREVAVGVIDVKAYRVETPEEVAARLRLALGHLGPSGCGWSPTAASGRPRATPRWESCGRWWRGRVWSAESSAPDAEALLSRCQALQAPKALALVNRLSGKVAVVTGAGSRGAGLGNGKATAILFAREGARVLCVDAVAERAEETVGLIHAEGGEAQPFVADVTRADECRAMVAAAVGRWGGLDVLHNNVGIESRKDLLDTTEEEWDLVMAVDLKSMFLATREAVPALIDRGGGSVICVSSVAGLRGHGRTAYAAAKAGVIGFVQSVAVQLGPRGIRVNAIAPGTVWTPMVESLGPEARERRRRASPLQTEGTGWDVGWGVVYLASDEARWVTGQVLVIDAGLTMTTR